MKKAVFYARVSSALQEKKRTIDSQIAELKKQVKSDGNVLVKEYTDDGYSGALLDRPGLNQMREDLRSRIFDTIYFINSDRIARDVTYQNIIICELLQYKKQIIINGKDYVHNPENKFTLTVLGAVAELERAKIIERHMRGRLHHLDQGLLLSHGCHIYGYHYIPKSSDAPPAYEIEESEAEIVRMIFKRYAKGNIGFKELTKQLNEQNVPTRADRKKWNDGQIKYLLQNETYTGTKYFNTMTDTNAQGTYEKKLKRGKPIPRDRSEWIGMQIPRVVPQELFDQVQERIRYNRECYRNAKRTQLLSNLVFCGKCNIRCFAYRRYYQVKRKKKTCVYQRAAYRCKSRTAGPHNPEIDTRVLESCVYEIIQATMALPDKLQTCLNIFKIKSRMNQAKSEKQLKETNEKTKAVEKKKKRIIDLYASGDLARGEYAKRITNYERESKELSNKHAELIKKAPLFTKPRTVKASLTAYCAKVKTRLELCSDFESRRKFMLVYIDKVEYSYSKDIDMVRIYGSVPVKFKKYDKKQKPEIVQAEFTIQKKFNRKKILESIKQQETEDVQGKQITSKEFGQLISNQTPECSSL